MESPKKSLPSSHHIERNKSRTRVGQTFLSVQITESRETLAQRACFVASRKLRRGGAAGQPAAHRVAISVVGRPKRGAEMRFFVQDYKEMGEQEPWQSENQDCRRLFVQAEAKEHDETAEIHRIARELVRTGGHKLARWIERRGRAFPAGDEGRHAGECEDSTGSHQRDAESALILWRGRTGNQIIMHCGSGGIGSMSDVLSLLKDVYSVSENFRDLKFKKAMQALEKEVLDVQEENAKLRAENTKLSNHLNARAEMKASGPHKYFYKNGQTDVPYCPKCWQRDQKEVLLPEPAKFAAGVGRQCTVCDKLYVEEPAKPLPPAIAIANPTPRHRLFR